MGASWSKGRRHMREIDLYICYQAGLEHDLWFPETSQHQEVYREKKIYYNFSFHFFCFVFILHFLFCSLSYIFFLHFILHFFVLHFISHFFVLYISYIFLLFFFCLGLCQGELVYPTHQAKHSLPLMCGNTICSLQAFNVYFSHLGLSMLLQK